MDIEEVKSQIIAEAEAHRDELYDLSRRIHDNPELGFHEFKASEWLTEYLEKNGFTIERGICRSENGFSRQLRTGRTGHCSAGGI